MVRLALAAALLTLPAAAFGSGFLALVASGTAAGADARLKSAEGKTAYELARDNKALAGSPQLEELRRAGP